VTTAATWSLVSFMCPAWTQPWWDATAQEGVRREMTRIATHRPLAEPFSTGASWLARAVAVSVVLHVVVAVAWWLVSKPRESEVELVDIELAPPPPPVEALPAEVARPPEAIAAAAAAATEPEPGTEADDGMA